MSTNTVLQSLTEDPAVKQAMLVQISARRAELQAEIAQLDEAEASLGGEAPKHRGRPKGKRGKRTGPSQRQQILAVLSKNTNGLKASAIAEKTGIEKKVLQTTLSVMRSKHKEVKVNGKARRDGGEGFVYLITKAGIASQKAAQEKAAEKSASASE